MSTIDFEIRLDIRGDLKRGLIFGLEARIPLGFILGFVDYRHEVLHLMQNLSHETRAYIVNAGGLPGFVEEFDISEYLRDSDQSGQL